jgi:DNA topoisomerase-1
VKIVDVKRRQKNESPSPPFSTDTLLQAAGSRWSWSPKKTAALASRLYAAGHLTYIRTDSTRLAGEAVEAGRAVIAATWGAEQLDDSATMREAEAGVQDAHEAIRPTELALETVPDVEPDMRKLYSLVRARTLASLMVSSLRVTLSLGGSCDGLDRTLDGSVGWYAELGWRRALEAAGLNKKSDVTPLTVSPGAILELTPGDADSPNPKLCEDETKPPARYKAHALVKAMKEGGIGRPSTFADMVDTLENRNYVTIEEGTVVPTENGRIIWLEAAPLFSLQNGLGVFSIEYTAKMELRLNDVAGARQDASAVWETMLDEFKSAHSRAQVELRNLSLPPTKKQKDFLEHLVKATGMDEVGACALVGANSYAELSSGKDGTASALIDALLDA